ncbi:hypothetical protein L9F63_009627, partial [Diploptera punctata]
CEKRSTSSSLPVPLSQTKIRNDLIQGVQVNTTLTSSIHTVRNPKDVELYGGKGRNSPSTANKEIVEVR